MSYQFELERGSTKHTCPECKRKSFVRYVDTEYGQYIADEVGRCDREVKCGYHEKPREYFQLSGENTFHKQRISNDCKAKGTTRPVEKPVFVPDKVFRGSLQNYLPAL